MVSHTYAYNLRSGHTIIPKIQSMNHIHTYAYTSYVFVFVPFGVVVAAVLFCLLCPWRWKLQRCKKLEQGLPCSFPVGYKPWSFKDVLVYGNFVFVCCFVFAYSIFLLFFGERVCKLMESPQVNGKAERMWRQACGVRCHNGNLLTNKSITKRYLSQVRHVQRGNKIWKSKADNLQLRRSQLWIRELWTF